MCNKIVDNPQYDISSIIVISLSTCFFSKDLKVQNCVVTYYSKHKKKLFSLTQASLYYYPNPGQ